MGMSLITAHLIAAAVGAVISLALGFVGLNRLKLEELTPTVTSQQVGRDVAAVKELAK